MSGISRVDRIIGAVLLLGLVALVALGVADRGASVPPPLSAPATAAEPPSVTAAPPSTTTPTPSPASTTSSTLVPIAGPVTVVGDSVILDAQPQLSVLVPGITVDGLVSRQFDAGVSVVQADKADGSLGRVLVVELGTNGPVSATGVDAIMQAASGAVRVVFVNVCVPRPWAGAVNAVLADGVARHPGVAVLADWNALATPHPEWFTSDQVHLNPAGAAALAGLIASKV